MMKFQIIQIFQKIKDNICGDACKQLCLYKNKIAMEHSSNLSYNDIYKLFMITVKKKKQEIGYSDFQKGIQHAATRCHQ